MKYIFRFCLLTFLWPLLTACPGPIEPVDSAYQPILMSRSQLESSVTSKPPMALVNPGKLYRYGNYLLINEQYKGVHIIDNQDPQAPVKLAFIQVPGNIDFAVKDNIMYVDNAVDLVALDLQNLNNIQVKQRIRNAFPALLPPDNNQGRFYLGDAPQNTVIVGWELAKTK